MARSVDPSNIISLPRVNAYTAVSLAQALEAASLDEDGNPYQLPEAVQAALDDVVADRGALQEAVGAPPPPNPTVRVIDLLEDNAVGALADLLRAWARVAGQIPQGDVAGKLFKRLFTGGLEFLNHKPIEEWAQVNTRLQIIQNEGLGAALGQLGAQPLLDHLQQIHVRYGEVTGATKAKPVPESPEVRANLDALLASIRHYVGSVVGSIVRKKPETKALAEKLLLPLTTWESTSSKPDDDEEPPPADS